MKAEANKPTSTQSDTHPAIANQVWTEYVRPTKSAAAKSIIEIQTPAMRQITTSSMVNNKGIAGYLPKS